MHFKINCGATDDVAERLEAWADKSCRDYQMVEGDGCNYLFIQRIQETTAKQLRKNLLTMLSHSKLPSPKQDPFVLEIPESEFLKQFWKVQQETRVGLS